MKKNTTTFSEIVMKRYNRRDMLQVLGATGISLAWGCTPRKETESAPDVVSTKSKSPQSSAASIQIGEGDQHYVLPGYRADLLIGWGDSLQDGSPYEDLAAMTPQEQAERFGTNCDFTAFMPLPEKEGKERGLLCVNHEFSDAAKMFHGLPAGRRTSKDHVSKIQVEGELAAHGHSVIEIQKEASGWKIVPGAYTRRLSALKTEFEIAGPAAGYRRMQTSEDPKGVLVKGTVGNCAGGVTPWGTLLIAEENFNYYFGGNPKGLPQEAHLLRYSVNGRAGIGSWRFFDRFNMNKEPNESNRFGWMFEYNPKDPSYQPRKRTALGRFCHEGAAVTLNEAGHAVVFMGDDSYFEYLYRFVSSKPAEGNSEVLDEGVLAVAQFKTNGDVIWLPLIYGQGPLTVKNGFSSQADVMIEARRAADLMGATPMDRPEGIAIHPKTGRVYVSLTKNKKRDISKVDAVHPRANDAFGRILEIVPSTKNAHGEEKMRWGLFIAAGDPSRHEKTRYGDKLSKDGWFSNPDNITFDPSGRLWICTDGALSSAGISDGLWYCDIGGPQRASPKRFLRVPKGAECTGASFTPDGKTLFVSVQHPGLSPSTYDKPSSRWPDHQPNRPARSAVLVITKEDGGVIGS